MANEAQLAIIRKGVKLWNKWREQNPETQVDLHGANLRLADLRTANLRRADLRGGDFRDVDFRQADFSGGVLSSANLSKANLGETDLTGADLSKADLSGVDLSGADLKAANLSGAYLSGALLIGTNLRGVDRSEADLWGMDLSRAGFSSALGSGIKLTESNPNIEDLIPTNLGMNPYNLDIIASYPSRIEFTWVPITNANFSGATVSRTVFADVDLSRVKGLETIKHERPSEISISTIYRSKGKIPFEFLRGAGVPDNFIEYMRSLTGAAFEFYSCFISYSSKDQPFAERLYADLQANGVRCWFAPHHGQAGQKLHEQIDQAIRMHEKLLLILSADSMKSEWVKTEIKKAAKRQKQEKKDVLFPVCLVPFDELREWECFDGDLGKDLGAEIREYLIPDFSRWKDHDSYQKAFAKLLKDLRAGKTKTV